ncbi:MAG: PGPGW domain-containing protein, partial [Candidatus Hydrogenedentales bacterium]
MKIMSAKRIVTLVVGSTVILGGVALLFLPGPGIAIIIGGLAILATEFVWARVWLRKLQREAVNMGSSIVGEVTMKKALGENFVENSRKDFDANGNDTDAGAKDEADTGDQLARDGAGSEDEAA